VKKTIQTAVMAAALAALTGCATIMGSPTQMIPINSTPSEAKVVITDEKGTEMFKGTTPTTVTLPKSNGSYWGKKSFTVKITKEGFQEQVIPVTANANGWYIAGNFFFGGLIGWFVIDPQSGNMYTLSPEAVTASLSGKAAHNNTGRSGEISIVLLQDVPADLQAKLTRVN
jgi:hypothetical protein